MYPRELPLRVRVNAIYIYIYRVTEPAHRLPLILTCNFSCRVQPPAAVAEKEYSLALP